MTANTDIRSKRRHDEYFSKQQYFSLEEVKQSLIDRDNEDINRQENPLIQAQDAVVIDNSTISREQQLAFVLKLIEDLKLISE
jgi:cytidylate kinase